MRVQVTMQAAELRMLDQWRAKRQVWSRAEAIRQLVAAGVKATPAPADDFAEAE